MHVPADAVQHHRALRRRVELGPAVVRQPGCRISFQIQKTSYTVFSALISNS